MNLVSLLDINPLELPNIESINIEALPNISAIYFVVVENVVVYIGKRKNLNNRWCITEHHIKEKLDTDFNIYWLSISTSKLNFAEQLLIEIHEPKLNRCKPIGNKNYVYTEKDLTDAFYLGYNKGLIKGIQLGKANTNSEVIKALNNQLKIRDIDAITINIDSNTSTQSTETNTTVTEHLYIGTICPKCNDGKLTSTKKNRNIVLYVCDSCKKSTSENILKVK